MHLPLDILMGVGGLLALVRDRFAAPAPPRLDDRLLADIGLLKCDLLYPDTSRERAD